MIRVKIVKENKEAVNELFGLGTTGKSKSTKPMDEFRLYSQLTQIEDKMDKKKLKDLGLSLTDLMHLVEQTLGIATGKIGSLQTISMSKVQALINLLSEEYKDILEKHKAKKISAIEANNLITGIAKIANFTKTHSISKFAESKDLQEQEKIEEILGMQNKALDKFIQSLKPVGGSKGPTSFKGVDFADKNQQPAQQPAQQPQTTASPEIEQKWEQIVGLVRKAIQTNRYQPVDDQDKMKEFKDHFIRMSKMDFSKLSNDEINREIRSLPTEARSEALKILRGQSKPAGETKKQTPPPAPKDDDSEEVQNAMTEVPPKSPDASQSSANKDSPEVIQDKINTYSKMASKQVQQKLNKMITPEDAKKVISILMNKNYLKESTEYDTLIDKIASETGMEKEVVTAILDSLQKSFKGELENMHFDKEREKHIGGMGTNESKNLKENLIARKNNSLSEQQVKRFKMLAGLL